MDLIILLRLAYLAAALAVLLVAVTPPLRSRFLAYGPRASLPAPASERAAGPFAATPVRETRKGLLDHLAQYAVPHSYFATFYALSLFLSAFWPTDILRHGPLFLFVANHTRLRTTSMTRSQLQVTWAMMVAQACRRLYECLILTRDGDEGEQSRAASKMWIGHWILGLAFYTATSVAVWVEGIPLQSHTLSSSHLHFSAPSLRTFLSVLLFIFASGFQYDCHAYLAALRYKSTHSASKSTSTRGGSDTYELPTHPAFHSLICPHYTAECLIYLSLAVVAAPPGAGMNWTLTSALVFVATNLGVTAAGTKEWYRRLFGQDAVTGKRTLLPFVW